MDLGQPGDESADATGPRGRFGVPALLQGFRADPVETKHAVRLKPGWCDEVAAGLFPLVGFVSDGLLRTQENGKDPARFFFLWPKSSRWSF